MRSADDLLGKHAAVIGIDAYGNGLAALRTAAADARAVAAALSCAHGYPDPIELLDGQATRGGIVRLLEQTLPATVAPDSRLVLYFAGHGVALDGDDGPQGYLIPQDARSGQPETWLPMADVCQALGALHCRHLLVVLDCCFAGSFRWAATRKVILPPRPLYDSQYARFLEGLAWQVLTSASHQEEAQDVVPGIRDARTAGPHSPFAAALLEALAGEADSSRGSYESDGVITATELYQYVFEKLVPADRMRRQTPGLWPLKPDNTGEFIFLSPGRKRKTLPDPPLDDANNPWQGLSAYGEGDTALFFGRERVVREVFDLVTGDAAPGLLAVIGASGSGKSSVVKAGVLPRLKATGSWTVVSAPRLAGDPRVQLSAAEGQLAEAAADRQLLFFDQFEELYTQCPERSVREDFLRRLRQLADGGVRVLLTLRSDFEPRLRSSESLGDFPGPAAGSPAVRRYRVQAPTLEELRQIIEEPAKAKALYFEPGELVAGLVDEVTSMPGALPLLSFALAEMYREARRRRRTTGDLDRALTRQDYDRIGGVVGALHRRADELVDLARARHSLATVRRVALRLVSIEGGSVTRRRISRRELEYAPQDEQDRVDRVIRTLTEARLVVTDEEYVEPAHDTLVQAWPLLTTWTAEAAERLPLLRAVWRDAAAWEGSGKPAGLLWNEDPRLPQAMDLSADLNALEGEFVGAGKKRRARRRLAAAAVTAAVMVLLAVAAIYSDAKRYEADNKTLAVQARRLQHGQLDLALLLSLELERRGETFEAHRGLFEGLESNPRLERMLRTDDEVRSLAYSADGRWLATAGLEPLVRLWDAATGQPRGSPFWRPAGAVWSLAWSPDSQSLAVGGEGGVQLWAVAAPRSKLRRLGEATVVYAVAWSPDGRTLAAARSDHSVALLDVETGSDLGRRLVGATSWLSTVVWSVDGSTVAASGMDKRIRRWDAATGEPIGPPLVGHEEGVLELAWSADGRILASGSLDGTARLWDATTGESLGRPFVGAGAVASVDWKGDNTLAVGIVDGSVVLWDSVTEQLPNRPLDVQLATLRRLSWSADGRTLASGNGSAVALWNMEDGPRLGQRVALDASDVRCAAMNREGTVLAAEARDPVSGELILRRWDAVSGKPQGAPLRGLRRRTGALAWSTDGQAFATVGFDRAVQRWELATGNLADEVRFGGTPSGQPSSLAWNADGTRLASGSRDGEVSLWDVATGQLLGRSGNAGKGSVSRVTSLSWSHDGAALAAGGKDGTVQLWRVLAGETAAIRPWGMPLRWNRDPVTSLAWSPDRRLLAAAGLDGVIVLWDVKRRQPFIRLIGNHPDAITGLLFGRDGTTLLSISLDGTLMRWDVDPASWRRIACHIVNRDLTEEEWNEYLPESLYRYTCSQPSSSVGSLQPQREAGS